MLSNVDIIRELGKNIVIGPLTEDTINGASINLTASNMAWSVTTTKSIVQKRGEAEEVIVIKRHDTGIIETNEIVGISNRLGGTYHSRVGFVSLGASHIGTVMHPGWVGRSLIAVHNHQDCDLQIDVGSHFALIVLHHLHSRSTLDEDNMSARVDVFTELGITLTKAEKQAIYFQYKTKFKSLCKEMKSTDVYRSLKRSIFDYKKLLIILFSFLLPAALLLSIYLSKTDFKLYHVIELCLVQCFSLIVGFCINRLRK